MWECVLFMLFSLSLVYASDSVYAYRSFFNYPRSEVDTFVEIVLVTGIGLFCTSLLAIIIDVVFDIEVFLATDFAFYLKLFFLGIHVIMSGYHYILFARYKRIAHLYY